MKMKKRNRESSHFFGPSITNAHHPPEEDGGNEEAESRRTRKLEESPVVRSGRLDGRVWRRLPTDMLLRVLALLPLHKQLELQTVCKSWRDFFRQGQVPALSSSGTRRRQETWVVVLPFYDPRWWSRDAFPKLVALSPKIHKNVNKIEWRWSGLPQRAAMAKRLMGSAGGLIVELCQDSLSLVVYNPLTNATKFLGSPRLPCNDLAPIINWDHMQMTMLAGSSSSFYQIVIMSLYLKGYMQVYDSRSCNWKALAARNLQSFVYDSQRQGWDQWEGHHFKTTATIYSHNVLDDDLFVLDKQVGAMYTYNAHRCMWSTVKTSAPSCPRGVNLTLETVVKCKGRILLVGCLESKEGDGSTDVGLAVWEWKLDISQGSSAPTWVELATTPRNPWEPYQCKMSCEAWCQLRCHVVPENLICVTGGDFEEAHECDNEFWTPLVYDVDGGSWECLPSWEGRTNYTSFFTFQPSWNAVP